MHFLRVKFSKARWALTFGLLWVLSCSSAKKKETPDLSELENQKIALVEIQGESTARAVIEVALVNQLVKHGSFILLPKEEVQKSKAHPHQDPTDFKGVAVRAGADYALVVKVLKFEAQENEGYSSETIEDSVLAEERGEDEATTQRYYKVKALTGEVEAELIFTELKTDKIRKGIAYQKKQVSSDARSSGIHLPPVLRFLEDLANEAFKEFFEEYR